MGRVRRVPIVTIQYREIRFSVGGYRNEWAHKRRPEWVRWATFAFKDGVVIWVDK